MYATVARRILQKKKKTHNVAYIAYYALALSLVLTLKPAYKTASHKRFPNKYIIWQAWQLIS